MEHLPQPDGFVNSFSNKMSDNFYKNNNLYKNARSIEKVGHSPSDYCGKGTFFLVPRDGKKGYVTRFHCHQWPCPYCGKQLADKWKGIIFRAVSRWKHTYITFITPEKNTAFVKSLSRSKIDYYTIYSGRERKLLFICSDVPKGPSKRIASKKELEKYMDYFLVEKKPLNGQKKIRHSKGLPSFTNGKDKKGHTQEDKPIGFYIPASLDQSVRLLSDLGCDLHKLNSEKEGYEIKLTDSLIEWLTARAKGVVKPAPPGIRFDNPLYYAVPLGDLLL